jgi:hypothetical protein
MEVERTVVEPMTATASRFHVTVSRQFLALLKKAKAGDSHRNPGASDEEVLTAALELLIEKQGKRKACVPAKVKREVVKRDQGKCQWKLADGGVCGATTRLEIDHVVPRGKGGPSTVSNTRVLCKSHNLEAARQVYGDAHMDLFTRGEFPGAPPLVREEVAEYGAGGLLERVARQAASGSPDRLDPDAGIGAIRLVMQDLHADHAARGVLHVDDLVRRLRADCFERRVIEPDRQSLACGVVDQCNRGHSNSPVCR